MLLTPFHGGQAHLYNLALIGAITSIGVWIITRVFQWWTTSTPGVSRQSTPDLEKKSATRKPGGARRITAQSETPLTIPIL